LTSADLSSFTLVPSMTKMDKTSCLSLDTSKDQQSLKKKFQRVVSVSFEEDDEGNLCLVAYPLSNDPAADLDIHDLSADCVFQGKTLQWGKKALVDKENRSKDSWSCNSHKDKSVQKLQEDQDVEQVQHVEGLHHGLEHSHSNAAPQVKRNPWSLECHQQHLQRMKENAKHRNQYSILP
uniref:Uncharacterized protein n=1 Tax=Oryzias melastigma TaxID=30732 RepID=A0A3B3BT72_ORYME